MSDGKYRQALDVMDNDLNNISAALNVLYGSFSKMNQNDPTGVEHLIRLISDDIDSLHDNVKRTLDGRCPIRGIAFSVLRPPERDESFHNQMMQQESTTT